MAKVLMIYAVSEYPTRNSIKDLLMAFRKYSSHKVFYFNLFTKSLPKYLRNIKFDLIVFHQTITLCGEKNTYLNMIRKLKIFFSESDAIRVALFQDEYFYTDMFVKFLNEMEIDYAFSVAPREEWNKIYEGVRPECKICPMLTGYIDQKSKGYYKRVLSKQRTIDVGYRVVWNKSSVVLGAFGYDKIRIAELFINRLDNKKYQVDVKTGVENIIKGKDWNRFLHSCRFILGVESGSGILDRDGSLREKIGKELRENPGVTTEDLYNKYVRAKDGNFQLRAISPRHFEAIEEGACQILYEGHYNGILKPYLHYIPLKKDHSNFNEIVKFLENEEERKKIVNRAFHDIVESGQYSYRVFIRKFYKIVLENSEVSEKKLNSVERRCYVKTLLHEWRIKIFLTVITLFKKTDLLKKMNKCQITKRLLNHYYAFRH